MPIARQSSKFSSDSLSPWASATCLASSAIAAGDNTFAGSFTRSRAKFCASAAAMPNPNPERTSGNFSSSNSTTFISSIRSDESFDVCLYLLKPYDPMIEPSAIACAAVAVSNPPIPAP